MKKGLTEGNQRKSYPAATSGPGGGRAQEEVGALNQSTSWTTRRGGFTPTVREPRSPAPTGGPAPLAKRVGPLHGGMKPESHEMRRNGAGRAVSGDTLAKDGHMNARSNTGARSAAYSTPSPKRPKGKP